MRVWRAGQLADELREGRLSEQQKFQYVLTTTLLHYLVGPQSLATGPRDARTVTVLAGSAAIALAGLLVCFRVNQHGDGRHFIERYMCLAVPCIVRTYTIGYLLYYGLAIAVLLMAGQPGLAMFRDAWRLPLVFGALLLVTYFLVLRHYFGRASAPATA